MNSMFGIAVSLYSQKTEFFVYVVYVLLVLAVMKLTFMFIYRVKTWTCDRMRMNKMNYEWTYRESMIAMNDGSLAQSVKI